MYTEGHNNLNLEPAAAPRKNRTGVSAGIVALSLVLALLAGAFGGAMAGYLAGRKTAAAEPASPSAVSTVPVYATALSTRDAKTINGIYEANKNAVVGIKKEGTTRNVFGQVTPYAASGTGFIISSDGYILTNNHVIEGAKKVTVTLFNEESYQAAVVGAAPDNDVALLKIDAAGLHTVTLGNSDHLVVGETVMTIGNPLGELTYTVTAGIVSAEDRDFTQNGVSINMFQTDAAINPGNSGGPVFNMNGEVIGIVTAKYASSVIEGIGFAIPINDAVEIANQLKETGHVKGRPYLGVSVVDAKSRDANLPDGAYIADIDPGGAAAKGGLRQGDVVTSFNGKTIKTASQLVSAVRGLKAGDTVNVVVYRGGRSVTLSVTLGENNPSV